MNLLMINLTKKDRVKAVNDRIKKTGGSTHLLLQYDESAVTDEISSKMFCLLNASERHGAAVLLNAQSNGIDLCSKEDFERASEYLSGYRVIPRIDSLPVLVKTEMFERFGLLDESFETIEGALADFSLRINQYGWSTIRVNAWSDAADAEQIRSAGDDAVIVNRYPYIAEIEDLYYVRRQRAVEHFAGVLGRDKDKRTSILFSLYEVPPTYNGTAHHALSVLKAFWKQYQDKYDISVLVKKNTDQFYQLSKTYPNVYYPENISGKTFELGCVTSQILCREHMDIIGRSCLQYGIWMLDIICLRSHYLCRNDMGRYDLFRDSLVYADMMFAISQSAREDILGYFYDDLQDMHMRSRVIHLGTDKVRNTASVSKSRFPFEAGNYFLVIGNPYKHKMIEPVLETLKETNENFLAVGTKTEGYYQKSKRIYGYVSGLVDSGDLDQMFAGAKGIIFPSVYEGFGLTLYDAVIYQKKIIVSDTEVNLELKELLSEYAERIITYRKPGDLKAVIENETFEADQPVIEMKLRSWDDAVREMETALHDMRERPIDVSRLENRWNDLKRYSRDAEGMQTPGKAKTEKRKAFFQRCTTRFPKVYKLYRKLVTAIDKEHYGNC